MKRVPLLVLPLLLSTACATLGRPGGMEARSPFGTVREQAERQQRWLRERLEVALPLLMDLHHVELWVVPVDESHEDPVFQALVGPTTLSARRRTVYVFHRTPEGVKRWALGGDSEGGLYEVLRSQRRVNPGTGPRQAELWGPEQWQRLRQLVEELQPRAIAINTSRGVPLADGLSLGEHEALLEALGPEWARRLIPAEALALDVLAWRSEDEGRVFEQLHQRAAELLAMALSQDVIHPGQTRASDVAWWLRQRAADLGLGVWLHPEVEVQRAGAGVVPRDEDAVIQRGDVLRCRLGLKALGLHSDTQGMGYVLREGEKDAPENLQRLLGQVHRIQALLLEEVGVGHKGNDVLRYTMARVDLENLEATVTGHPIGLHGHGAGPLIGLWDWPQGVPGLGDLRVKQSMWFSLEVQASGEVPEWNRQRVGVTLEEGLLLDARGRPRWALLPQPAFHLVR